MAADINKHHARLKRNQANLRNRSITFRNISTRMMLIIAQASVFHFPRWSCPISCYCRDTKNRGVKKLLSRVESQKLLAFSGESCMKNTYSELHTSVCGCT